MGKPKAGTPLAAQSSSSWQLPQCWRQWCRLLQAAMRNKSCPGSWPPSGSTPPPPSLPLPTRCAPAGRSGCGLPSGATADNPHRIIQTGNQPRLPPLGSPCVKNICHPPASSLSLSVCHPSLRARRRAYRCAASHSTAFRSPAARYQPPITPCRNPAIPPTTKLIIMPINPTDFQSTTPKPKTLNSESSKFRNS